MTLPEIIDFLAEQLAVSADRLSPDSNLCRDFRIDGDDCLLLMKAYADHFSVDMRGYRWDRHHGVEGFDPGVVVFDIFFRRRRVAPPLPLSPRLLFDCAKAGQWLVDYPPDPDLETGFVNQPIRSVVGSFFLLLLIAAISFISAILWQ